MSAPATPEPHARGRSTRSDTGCGAASRSLHERIRCRGRYAQDRTLIRRLIYEEKYLVYVLSDGGWADTQAGVERIRWLADHDVPTIHLAIGIAPLSVECDRIHVITDPAQALDHIAADTVAALQARVRARPTAPST